jgi:DNA-binding MarR family transcriptional regulator
MSTSAHEPPSPSLAPELPSELPEELPRCLGRSVLMTGRAVSRVYNDFLRASGLHATQFQVLVAVRIDRYETLAQLADQLSLERTTLLRNLELLRRQGLVAEAPARRGRAKRYALTAAGEAMLVQTLPLWRAAQAAFDAALGPAGDEVRDGLRRLRRAAEAIARDRTAPTDDPVS